MNRAISRILVVLAMSSLMSAPALADRDGAPRAGEAVMDAVVARPLGIVVTAGGAFVWGISLPFSLLGGNAGDMADLLVGGPGRETFARCLGCRSNERTDNTGAPIAKSAR